MEARQLTVQVQQEKYVKVRKDSFNCRLCLLLNKRQDKNTEVVKI